MNLNRSIEAAVGPSRATNRTKKAVSFRGQHLGPILAGSVTLGDLLNLSELLVPHKNI